MAKTLRSRIAAVAVAALGIGLLQAAPASADATATTATAISGSGAARIGSQLLAVRVVVSFPASTCSDPSANTVYLAVGAAGIPSAATLAASTWDATKTDGSVVSLDTATITNALGYKLGSGDCSLGSTVITFRAPSSGNTITAGDYNFVAWVDASTGADAPVEYPKATSKSVAIKVTAGGVPASVTVSPTSANVATSSDTAYVYATPKDANGVATLLKVNETFDVTESLTTQWTINGSTTNTLTGATYVGRASSSGYQRGNGQFRISVTTGTGATGTNKVTVTPSGLLTGLFTAESAYISVQVRANIATEGWYFDSSSGIIETAPDGVTWPNPASTKWAATIERADDVYKASRSFYVSTDLTSVKFDVASNSANANLPLYVAATTVGGYKAPSGFTADEKTITLDAYGYGEYTVSTSGAVDGQAIKVYLGTTSYTLYFSRPQASLVRMGPNLVVLAENKTEVAPTATVYDQFGRPFAGALVTMKADSAGRNYASAAVIASGTSDSKGVVTGKFTDSAANSAALTSDAVTASATYAGSTETITTTYVSIIYASDNTADVIPQRSTVTFNWTSSLNIGDFKVEVDTTDTDLNPTSFGGGDPKTAYSLSATKRGVMINPLYPGGSTLSYIATVKDSNGTLLYGVPVAFTVTGGFRSGYFTTSGTVYTGSTGTATFSVKAVKTGVLTVTATAGTKTSTDATVTAYNKAGDAGFTASSARKIALDAAAYAVATGSLKRVTATVTDAYGNPVSGVTVNFSISGAGRFSGSSLSTSGVTDATGAAVADLGPLVGDAAGTGTITASFSGGDTTAVGSEVFLADTSDLYPAAVTSAKGTITVTKGTDANGAAIDAVKTQVAALSTTITSIQTAMSTLVASVTATLTAMSAQINKIMKKLKIK